MGKNKKKKHAKSHGISDDLIDSTAMSIKRFRKITNEISKLSTGQKLVGSMALLAAGYLYYDKVKREGGQVTFRGLTIPLPRRATTVLPVTEEIEAEVLPVTKAETSRKSRKNGKAGKAPGSFGRKPAASPDADDF